MVHLQRLAVEQAVCRFRRSHLDAQAPALEQDVEGKPSERLWQPWREGERAVLPTQATEPGDQRRPGARQGSHVDPVLHVVMQVVEVYERSFTEVIVGELELAHLGSQDSLCAGRQR